MTEIDEFDEIKIKEEICIEYNCCICNQGFEYETDLRKHLELHEEVTSSPAAYLQYKNNKEDLSKLTKDQLGDKPFECKICGKIFDTPRGIMAHNRFHLKKDIVYYCDKCPISYKRKDYIRAHVLLHCEGYQKTPTVRNEHKPKKVEGDFECKICGKKFTVKQNFKSHCDIVHSDNRPYKCSICGSSFKKTGGLKEHQVLVHSDIKKLNPKIYECEKCSVTFSRLQNLKQHREIHLKELPCECEVCGRSLAKKRYLKNHMKLHSGLNQFECEKCGRTYNKEKTFREHIRVQHEEKFSKTAKRRKCEKCGSAFRKLKSLRRHWELYHSSKSYTCDKCGESFDKRSLIIKHMRFYIKNPFRCGICGWIFKRKCTLYAHKRVHKTST